MSNQLQNKLIHLDEQNSISLDLADLATAAITYYGEDYADMIYSALDTTEFIQTNKENGYTMYDILNKITKENNIAEEIDETIVSDSALKKASGVHSTLWLLDENGSLIFDENGSPTHLNIIGYTSLSGEIDSENYMDDELYKSTISNIAHEFVHSIMSQKLVSNLNMKTAGLNLINYTSGFKNTTYEIIKKDGKHCLKIIKDYGGGLEEGFTENDALGILKIMGIEHTSDAYKFQRLFDERLELEVSKEVIQNARLNKNTTDIVDKLGQDTFNIVTEFSDSALMLHHKALNNLFNPDISFEYRQKEVEYLVTALEVVDISLENETNPQKINETLQKVENLYKEQIFQNAKADVLTIDSEQSFSEINA